MAKVIAKPNLNQTAKLAGSLAVLIIAFSVFYYWAVLPYQREKGLAACLDRAKEEQEQKWMAVCRSLYNERVIEEHGLDKLCESMAVQHAEPVFEYYQRLKDDCLVQYRGR